MRNYIAVTETDIMIKSYYADKIHIIFFTLKAVCMYFLKGAILL